MVRRTAKNKPITDVDIYTSKFPQPQREIVQRLRTLIANDYPELTESLKWHVPIYSLSKTNHMLGIQAFQRHVNLNFFNGAALNDPLKILVGNGPRVRHITFRVVNDIDVRVLRTLISEAIVNDSAFSSVKRK